ncbi:MAG TPA: hypothetical protein VMW41_06035 [Candidatus Bathyarchaeia archaeon]|nr:hypothetical protein [Candidatus Bathyarchaeia archaeon]
MKIVRKYNASIISGVVILGSFKRITEVVDAVKNKIKGLVGKNYREVEATKELLRNITNTNRPERVRFLMLDRNFEERVYTLMFIDKDTLIENASEVVCLIAEKRPLKLIPIIRLNSISDLSQYLKDSFFGNFGYFILGTLNRKDKDLLKINQIK